MANWNNPTVDSNYITFVDEVKNRDIDNARMFDGTAATNIPTLTIRWNQSNNRFERWSGTAWEGRTIGITGGGTGATTPSGARSALGLRLMAQQAPDDVSITGGSITGVSFSGTGTLSGNASTASTWQTARTLQIGNTGKSVNGSANVTWTAAEIGTSNNTGNTVVTRNASGNFSAGTITANGSALTNLNASNLTTGVVPDAQLPAHLSHRETTIDLSNVFGFSGGTVYLQKIGRMVTMYVRSASFASSTSTVGNVVPSAYRPQSNVGIVSWFDENHVERAYVSSQGQLQLDFRNWSGSPVSRSSSFGFGLSWVTQF